MSETDYYSLNGTTREAKGSCLRPTRGFLWAIMVVWEVCLGLVALTIPALYLFKIASVDTWPLYAVCVPVGVFVVVHVVFGITLIVTRRHNTVRTQTVEWANYV